MGDPRLLPYFAALLRFAGEKLRPGRGFPLLLTALFAALSIAAASSDPAERLSNPQQEARARALFTEVRCLVCQNESIDDSDADLASDLRRAVRAQVAQGRSNAQVKRYLTDRYGEFVLLKPSFSPGNALLWLAPFGIVMIGGAVFALRSRRVLAPVTPLSDEEEAALKGFGQGSAAETPHEKRAGVSEDRPKTIGA